MTLAIAQVSFFYTKNLHNQKKRSIFAADYGECYLSWTDHSATTGRKNN